MWNKQPPLQTFGALQAVDFPSEGKPTIVLFHGYGADAFDLAPMAEELGFRQQYRWLFPQGFKTVDIGGGFQGRAWFDIDMEAHERAIRSGKAKTYGDTRPAGVNEARDKALSFLKALNVPTSQLILGGFSQGAMMAVELATTLPEPVKGVVILSGTLADRQGLKTKAPSKKGIPFFQSHGEQDPLLAFSAAEELRELLEEAGWEGTWSGFPGGHEIPLQVFRDLQRFLRNLK